MSDEMLYLNSSIHINYLAFELTDEIKDNLLISFDGTIMGVKKSYIATKHNIDDKILYNLGYKEVKLPKSIKTEEDLIYCLYLSL